MFSVNNQLISLPGQVLVYIIETGMGGYGYCTCMSNCLSTNHTGALPPQPPLSAEKQKSTVLTNPVSACDFLNYVAMKILDKWKMFGIHLEIPIPQLNTYPSHDPKTCLINVFDSWERKGSPELSWKTVIDILPKIDEERLAEEIEKMIPPSHTLL